jgi:hypothetical protein
MVEKILALIAVGALACIPVAFGIRNFVEARSMAVVESSDDQDHLERAAEYAFFIANTYPVKTNGPVVANVPPLAPVDLE